LEMLLYARRCAKNHISGNVKLLLSPGKAGGLPKGDLVMSRSLSQSKSCWETGCCISGGL